MEQTAYTSLEFFLMSGVEAVAFLCVTAFALRRLDGGAVGLLALLAGSLGLLSSGAYAVAWAQVEWDDSFSVLEAITTKPLLEHLDWVRVIALVPLALAVILSTRRADPPSP